MGIATLGKDQLQQNVAQSSKHADASSRMAANLAAVNTTLATKAEQERKEEQEELRPNRHSSPAVLGIMLVFITISMGFVAFVNKSDEAAGSHQERNYGYQKLAEQKQAEAQTASNKV